MFKNICFKSSFIINRRFYSNNLTIANIFKQSKEGDKIILEGWVKAIRKLKQNIFLDVSDGSTSKVFQVQFNNSLKPTSLSFGSSIRANGNLNLSPNGQLELNAEAIDVVGECELNGYPFLPKKSYPDEYIRQHLHFRSRTQTFSSLLRVRSAANLAVHQYFNKEGYMQVHTPVITSNDCEGAGEVFTVYPENKQVLFSMRKPNKPLDEVYFNNKVFLTVSGQFHLEIVSHGISKVYSFGPTFRAENSRSRLHLSEFYMLEAELAFINNLDELMLSVEHLLKEVTKDILNKNEDDVRKVQADKEIDLSWCDKKFPVLTYDEAIRIMSELNKDFHSENGLSKEDEISLVQHCGNLPIFIINWPKNEKPFYMKECDHDPNKVSAFDLLAPNVGEIVGGSLRENNYSKLKEKLPSGHNLDWYLDLRRYGSVPTGGYGLGFERYLQFILGISNIKDTIPFPRWPHNCNL